MVCYGFFFIFDSDESGRLVVSVGHMSWRILLFFLSPPFLLISVSISLSHSLNSLSLCHTRTWIHNSVVLHSVKQSTQP